jgi:hypothetical protein
MALPHYTPTLPSVAPGKDKSHWGRSLNSGRLMSKEAETPAAALDPLRQTLGPPLPQADGSYVAGSMQISVLALHYHRPPELVVAHPSILRGTTGF